MLISFRYIIGTQDRDLQEKVRLIAGVPLLYIHQKAPTLEAASLASLTKSDKISQEKYESNSTALKFFAYINHVLDFCRRSNLEKASKKLS